LHSCADVTVVDVVQEKRQAHQVLVSQHSTILDLLEVPQLIDTCVRNNSYDEALDLLALVAKLTVVAGGSSVVHRLASEAADARKGLQKQLLSRLGQSITLPECLRCVSYLRRLSVFPESDLRVQFLLQRDLWCA
jgi:conserved oligomeric Golgi complex subunit 8